MLKIVVTFTNFCKNNNLFLLCVAIADNIEVLADEEGPTVNSEGLLQSFRFKPGTIEVK